MSKSASHLPPLEEGLLQAFKALDNQVAREMQRSPAELEARGIQKWEPYMKRIENVCAFLLNALGDRRIELDSLLIVSQATAKCLQMVVDDLGEKGLGKVRTGYCLGAFEALTDSARQGLENLKSERALS